MLLFIRRRYKSESRLPFDLRPHPYKYPGLSLLGYTFILRCVSDPDSIHLKSLPPRLLSRTFNHFYRDQKYTKMKSIIPGHIVCICIVSKTFFLQTCYKPLLNFKRTIHNMRALNAVYGLEWLGKVRSVFGLCVWRHIKKDSGVILVKSKFLGVHFLYKVNIYAPNVLSFLNIERRFNIQTNLVYKKTRHPSFLFKVKSYEKIFKRSIKKKG